MFQLSPKYISVPIFFIVAIICYFYFYVKTGQWNFPESGCLGNKRRITFTIFSDDTETF